MAIGGRGKLAGSLYAPDEAFDGGLVDVETGRGNALGTGTEAPMTWSESIVVYVL